MRRPRKRRIKQGHRYPVGPLRLELRRYTALDASSYHEAGADPSSTPQKSATSGVKKPGNTAAHSSRAKAANNRRNRDNHTKSSQTPPQNPPVAQQPSSDFNIRGRASGPAVVIGSNFAPGTTAEDIQSAFEPVGGTMLSCRVISTYPTVVAEMTFVEPHGAEAVVASFNNQKVRTRSHPIRFG